MGLHPVKPENSPIVETSTEPTRRSLYALLSSLDELVTKLAIEAIPILKELKVDNSKNYATLAKTIKEQGLFTLGTGLLGAGAGLGSAYFDAKEAFKNLAQPLMKCLNDGIHLSYEPEITLQRGKVSATDTESQREINTTQMMQQGFKDSIEKVLRAWDSFTTALAQSARSTS